MPIVLSLAHLLRTESGVLKTLWQKILQYVAPGPLLGYRMQRAL